MTLRRETRARARALQLLYAWETTGHELNSLITGIARLTGPEPTVLDQAESLARGVIAERERLDQLLATATDNWRVERLGLVDRNILRLATFELANPEWRGASDCVRPKTAIDEALWLAHRFGTPQSPAFVNGVLDRIARTLGRL